MYHSVLNNFILKFDFNLSLRKHLFQVFQYISAIDPAFSDPPLYIIYI